MDYHLQMGVLDIPQLLPIEVDDAGNLNDMPKIRNVIEGSISFPKQIYWAGRYCELSRHLKNDNGDGALILLLNLFA